jgi:hypothetical protein
VCVRRCWPGRGSRRRGSDRHACPGALRSARSALRDAAAARRSCCQAFCKRDVAVNPPHRFAGTSPGARGRRAPARTGLRPAARMGLAGRPHLCRLARLLLLRVAGQPCRRAFAPQLTTAAVCRGDKRTCVTGARQAFRFLHICIECATHNGGGGGARSSISAVSPRSRTCTADQCSIAMPHKMPNAPGDPPSRMDAGMLLLQNIGVNPCTQAQYTPACLSPCHASTCASTRMAPDRGRTSQAAYPVCIAPAGACLLPPDPPAFRCMPFSRRSPALHASRRPRPRRRGMQVIPVCGRSRLQLAPHHERRRRRVGAKKIRGAPGQRRITAPWLAAALGGPRTLCALAVARDAGGRGGRTRRESKRLVKQACGGGGRAGRGAAPAAALPAGRGGGAGQRASRQRSTAPCSPRPAARSPRLQPGAAGAPQPQPQPSTHPRAIIGYRATSKTWALP